MDNSLTNQRIVIVGGSSGIGLGVAQAAAAAGARVVIASSKREKIDRALATLPGSAEGRVVDASSETSMKTLFDELGEIDHLVYTAGEALALGAIADVSSEAGQRFHRVRFWGAYDAARFARVKKGGSITFTGGSAGVRPMAGWSVAASVCMAIEGLTRALAVELAPTRVNCVRSGAVDTELWSGLPAGQRDALFTQLSKQLPVGRVGNPRELGEAYLFLVRNGFVSGAIVAVDGGGALA